jgi:hypothetical protein
MMGAVMHNFARSYAWTMPVLETGVERRADFVMMQEAPEERGGLGISHSASEMMNGKRVWTVVRKVSGMATD